MSHEQTYSTQSNIFQELLSLLGQTVQSELMRQIQYLTVENNILRSKCPDRITTTADEKKRLLKFGLPLGGKIKGIINIVNYSTFRRWATDGETAKGEKVDRRGRTKMTSQEIIDLMIRMAKENALWGFGRIMGELKKLGIKRARNTIKSILIENGIDPSPKRKEDSWDAYIKRTFATLWACDFFTKTVWTAMGPKIFHVLFFINIRTRKVHIAGATDKPTHEWVTTMTEKASNIFAGDESKLLIRDGDKKFPKQFNDMLKKFGITVKRLPYRAPNLNPYAEAWIGTIKRECLNNFLVLGKNHLEYLINEFVGYYNTDRPHSGLGNATISSLNGKTVKCEERLGGLIKKYNLN
ncbi:MAG: integrase core domain-containing protein [Candidatus Omnitrophica bacterium]|nr:integrase core domain-containing protein [Candidatus Omnitrophota bacterium]